MTTNNSNDRSHRLNVWVNPTKWSPILFITLYFFWIPLFAIIFSKCMGDEFYHSTVRYEPGLNDQGKQLVQELQDSIVQTFRAGHGGDVAVFDGSTIKSDSLRVTYLRPTEDAMNFGMSVTVNSSPSSESDGGAPGYQEAALKFEATYMFGPRRGGELIVGEPPTFFELLSFDPQDLTIPLINKPVDYQIMFPPTSQRTLVPLLALSAKVNDDLTNFWRATQGHPARVSGQFWRMLYLSSITVTTVGFGDIVPLTSSARFAVALEAVLGIMTIGFFINSVFVVNRPGKSGGSKP